MSASPAALDVVPSGATLGADVRDLDLARALDEATVAAIRAAWHRHLVLRFHDQHLDPAALAAFSARFGTLEAVPGWRDKHPPGAPQVLIVSNVREGDRSIGVLGAGEAEWHTDMSYIDTPPTASVLHALEVPEAGGDTAFVNMYAALEAVPPDLREAVAGRALNHDSSHDSSGTLRPGAAAPADARAAPGARHPLVRVHPETGRAALYLGRRRNAWVVGLSLAESEALLDRLWAHVCRDEFVWRQSWRPGDVVMWDNRCTMHRRDAFDPAARRIMHRTQIRGEAAAA